MDESQATVWRANAVNWSRIGPPLRPCAEDIALMRDCVQRQVAGKDGELRSLLLGVTPEIATLDFGRPLHMVAADNSLMMIGSVWPGNTPVHQVICADWRRLPLRQGVFDLVLADGSLSMQSYPEGFGLLGAGIAACLKPGGAFIVRAFCRPEIAEPVEAVFADMRARRIGNFNVFKWRLAMAVQGDHPSRAVCLADIWETCRRHVGNHEALAAATGWPIDVIGAIDAHRNSEVRYSFPAVSETIQALAQYFDCVEKLSGHYELAERCPLLVFVRRIGSGEP